MLPVNVCLVFKRELKQEISNKVKCIVVVQFSAGQLYCIDNAEITRNMSTVAEAITKYDSTKKQHVRLNACSQHM